MQDLHGRDGHQLSISLQPLPVERYGRMVQIRDLAERFAYALSAGAERIDLPLPFSVHRDGEELEKQPTEMLMIVRTLMQVLGQSTFKGKVPIADGIEAFLFDRQGQGILMLWDRGRGSDIKQLPLNLGPHATRIDLWGNATPLLRADSHNSEQQQAKGVPVEVGEMPFFILDIDGQLAQLRASENNVVDPVLVQAARLGDLLAEACLSPQHLIQPF